MSSPPRPRFRLWSAETGVFVVVWLALLAAGRDRMIRDPGTFWHTVVGRQIVDQRDVVRTDSFSFRFAGKSWFSHQWLGELSMALVDRLAGLDGLLLGAVTLLAATYACAARRMLSRGISWPIVVVFVAIAIAASSHHFLPRPHLIGIPALGLLLALLSDYERARLRPVGLLAMPILFLVWANVHGTALGGIATLWIVLLGWTALTTPPFRSLRLHRPPPLAAAYAVAVSATLAILVNPFGIQLPRVWIDLLTAPSLPKLIVEHAPLSLSSADGWSVVAFGIVYLLMLWRARRSTPGITTLVPLIWLALSIQRIRHGPLFAITALVGLADLLPSALPASTESPPPRRTPWYAATALPAVLVIAAAVLQALGVRVPLVGAGWARLAPGYWPVAALPHLKQRIADGPAASRILNDMTFGGFLIYYCPDARVFIDDRCELYGEQNLQDYVDAAARHPSKIDEWSSQFDAGTALVYSRSPFDEYLRKSPAWRCLYRDACCALYVRAP